MLTVVEDWKGLHASTYARMLQCADTIVTDAPFTGAWSVATEFLLFFLQLLPIHLTPQRLDLLLRGVVLFVGTWLRQQDAGFVGSRVCRTASETSPESELEKGAA